MNERIKMNERLKELEKQSVYYNEEEDVWEFDREKFAELIVKECIDIVPWQYESKIKEHFGVES